MVLRLKGIDAPPASDGAGRFEEACDAVEVASKDLSNASMIEFYGGFLQAVRVVSSNSELQDARCLTSPSPPTIKADSIETAANI